MMFPHTITIYHKTTENGQYVRSVVHGALWEDLKGRTIRKTGITPQDRAQVYIPMQGIDISDGDLIVKGECPTVITTSSKEIPQALYVTAVETYDYGTGQDHWRVTAR